jgi:hypothetical protein
MKFQNFEKVILKKKENRSRKGKRVFIDGWILQSLKVKL